MNRSRVIKHPLGDGFRTPLLVPSFSSKGTPPRTEAPSVIAEFYEVATEYLVEAQLLSAYDIYHGDMSLPTSQITTVTVLDSGGYEVSSYEDLSAIVHEPPSQREWTPDMYRELLARWPAHIPTIVVSFDAAKRRVPFHQQVAEAAELRRYCPNQLLALLVKPETERQKYIQLDSIFNMVSELRSFDVIGVTEKELGASTLDRMVMVAKLRRMLDEAKVPSPIHVFGCLDPIAVPLLFIAGAEIFDGLSWMRYGFGESVAMYRFNYGTLRFGIDRRDDLIRLMTLHGNIEYLRSLANRLIRFAGDADYGKLGDHADVFRDAAELMHARLREA